MRGEESENRECLDVLYLSVPLYIYVRFLLTKLPEKQLKVVKYRSNLRKIMYRSFLGNLFVCRNYFRHAVEASVCVENVRKTKILPRLPHVV